MPQDKTDTLNAIRALLVRRKWTSTLAQIFWLVRPWLPLLLLLLLLLLLPLQILLRALAVATAGRPVPLVFIKLQHFLCIVGPERHMLVTLFRRNPQSPFRMSLGAWRASRCAGTAED